MNLMYFTWLYQMHCSRMQVAANVFFSFTATDSSHIGTQHSWWVNQIYWRQAIQKHQNLVRGARCWFPIHFPCLSRFSLNMGWIFLYLSDNLSFKMPLNSTNGETYVRRGVYQNGINLFNHPSFVNYWLAGLLSSNHQSNTWFENTCVIPPSPMK